MSPESVKNQGDRRYRKLRTGVVTSNKMDKTVVVAIERYTKHPVFHKGIRVQKKIQAHDEKNKYQIGDLVQIIETRPLSKNKRWRVTKLLERAIEEGK